MARRQMVDRIHDDEPDTRESVVRSLLSAQCPRWADRPLELVGGAGTDHAMWRVRSDDEPEVVVRLPRRPSAADGVANEIAVLDQLEGSPVAAIVEIPVVHHVGRPHPAFPHDWSVLGWIDGVDAWSARSTLDRGPLEGLATDLGRLVGAIRETDARAPHRGPGSRGGPLGPLLDRLDRWLDDPAWQADALLDVAGVRRRVAEAAEVVDEVADEAFVHGDLIPGNLLVSGRRLGAVLDWGVAGRGDPAQDLAPAWSVLTGHERDVFRGLVDADDAAWIRGRAFELEHAVGGVLYYRPRRHPLGDVMARTLERILGDR